MKHMENKNNREEIIRGFYNRTKGEFAEWNVELDVDGYGDFVINFTPVDEEFAVFSWLCISSIDISGNSLPEAVLEFWDASGTWYGGIPITSTDNEILTHIRRLMAEDSDARKKFAAEKAGKR